MRVRMRLQRILIAAAVPALSLGISAPALATGAGSANRPAAPAVQRHDQHQAASAADPWGAIAYSPQTGGYGYSTGYSNQTQADIAALGYCTAHENSGCVLLISFQNSWGALAVGSNRASGTGRGVAAPEVAGYYALVSCIDHGGTNCRVRFWVHS